MASRRTFLATGALVLAAGCLDATGRGPTETDEPDESPTDEDSPDHTDDHPTGDCHSGVYVGANDIDPPQDLPVDLSDPQRSLVADATDGAVEIDTYAHRPLRDGVFVRHDGRFLETGVEQVGAVEIPARVSNLDWEEGRTPPDGAEVVEFPSLPPEDREALRFVVEGPEYAERPEGHPSQGLSAEDVPVPYPDGTDGSRLVGAGTVWVHWNDRYYRVEVTTESDTVTRRTYRIGADEVASTGQQFTQVVVDRYLVALEDLSDDERRILTTAADDTYEECGDGSEALQSLRDRLSEHDQLPHPEDQSWFVSFEGDRYALEFTNWVA